MLIYHVAVNGEDNDNKTFLGLDAKHPFATIDNAYKKAVQKFESGELEEPAQILVHKGTYKLQDTLCFFSKAPVVIKPYEKDEVVLSGGLEIKEWTKVKVNGKTALRAPLPENITELPHFYVNGVRAVQASLPKKGLYRVTDDREDFAMTESFHAEKGSVNPKWYDFNNVWVCLTRLWLEAYSPLKSFNPETLELQMTYPLIAGAGKKDSEYRFFNVKEALTEPGEYYFDRNLHEVLYIPRDKKAAVATVPVRGELMRFNGAENVRLSGFKFEYAGGYQPVLGKNFDLRNASLPDIPNMALKAYWEGIIHGKTLLCSHQAAHHVPGIINMQNTTDCVITGCEFVNCGWYAVNVACGCKRIRIENNEMHELGGGGVRIGGADAARADKTNTVSTVTVRSNHIHHIGIYHYAAIGILITDACKCLLENNHIHDLNYSGISVGWEWGFGPTATNEVRIIGNHIHDLGKGVLSDMGGIYTLGTQPGTQICGNVIHDIVNRYYGGWGIYPDEGSSHIVIEHNVVYDCACEAFHQHYGRENMVRFNVFAFGKENGIATTRHTMSRYAAPGPISTKDVIFYHNVILTDGVPPMRYVLQTFVDEGYTLSDHNFFYDISKAKKKLPFIKIDLGDVKEYSLKDWQDRFGNDRHSFFGKDPGFVNAAKRDFRLKKNSILFDYGFKDVFGEKK